MSNNNENHRGVSLMEDEPIICRVTSRILATDGCDVDVAINGLIVKDKIDADKKYEFLIFDIRKPAISGIQLYEYLEQVYPELASRVMFTTGDSMGVATKKFLERVHRLFLSKPYTPTQLRNLVRETHGINVAHP
jgi:DNA-binding NtrC family response regulator